MNVIEKKIRKEANRFKVDVDDLGNLVVARLREHFDDPIGGLIHRDMIKNDTEPLHEAADKVVEFVKEENEREAKKRENKTS